MTLQTSAGTLDLDTEIVQGLRPDNNPRPVTSKLSPKWQLLGVKSGNSQSYYDPKTG